ncbi:MAG: DUF1194 domain-containing protein [Rhodovibrionaceae bacterium]
MRSFARTLGLLPVAVALIAATGSARAQQTGVDLELVLLADGSRSIDDAEIRFQRDGYAEAITHPQVIAASTSGYYQRIAVTYVEWGEASSQVVIVPWTVIDGPDSAEGFAEVLRGATQRAQGSNAIGTAIARGQELIETNDYDAARKVIDFSGDSAYSERGIPIAAARESALAAGITINALAVLCYSCSGPPVGYDLSDAYERLIIGGPGSFVLAADNETEFTVAVRRKLVLEIAGSEPGENLARR